MPPRASTEPVLAKLEWWIRRFTGPHALRSVHAVGQPGVGVIDLETGEQRVYRLPALKLRERPDGAVWASNSNSPAWQIETPYAIDNRIETGPSS